MMGCRLAHRRGVQRALQREGQLERFLSQDEAAMVRQHMPHQWHLGVAEERAEAELLVRRSDSRWLERHERDCVCAVDLHRVALVSEWHSCDRSEQLLCGLSDAAIRPRVSLRLRVPVLRVRAGVGASPRFKQRALLRQERLQRPSTKWCCWWKLRQHV